MTKPLLVLLVTAALISCGSNKPTATPKSDPAEHTDSGSAAAVVQPKEPDKPADPPMPDTAKVNADLIASESSAWETAKPAFTAACATCHTKAGKKSAKKKLDHFSLDSYPPGGHHTATIGFTIRDVLGISGKKPTMPYDKPGSVKGDDLAKIKAWTDAWEAAEKAGAHPPVAAGKADD